MIDKRSINELMKRVTSPDKWTASYVATILEDTETVAWYENVLHKMLQYLNNADMLKHNRFLSSVAESSKNYNKLTKNQALAVAKTLRNGPTEVIECLIKA